MMRAQILATAALLSVTAVAQAPLVTFSADINPQITMEEDGLVRLRFYDDAGNFSRLRMNLLLENGWHLRFFQKLGRIANDADDSSVDEVYVERPGDWRVGKQYLPFGSGRLLKETGIGGRLDTYLAIADMPISAAIIENGHGRQSGFIARLGGNIGISVAVGRHFGINATSFTQLHNPERSPGKGRGHRMAFGVDSGIAIGGWKTTGEWVALRDGHTTLDPDEDVLNLMITYQFPYGPLIESEITRAARAGLTNLRFAIQLPVSKVTFIVPSARFYDGEGWEYSILMRIRV